MNTPQPRPRLKRLTNTPDQPGNAEPPSTPTGRSAPKVAARKGIPSAVRPDPHPSDSRWGVAWLHIAAPKGAAPTATSRCACGRDRSAVGHKKVLALIEAHTAHRDACPLRTNTDRKNAA